MMNYLFIPNLWMIFISLDFFRHTVTIKKRRDEESTIFIIAIISYIECWL